MPDELTPEEQAAIAAWLERNSPTIVARGVGGAEVTKGWTAQQRAKVSAKLTYLRKLRALKRLGIYEYIPETPDTTLNLE